MNKAKRILLASSGVLLCWVSAMWAVVFFRILRDGQITLIEPSLPILIAELTLSLLLVVVGVACVIVELKRED